MSTRLLANENIPLPSVTAPRSEGCDVLSISELSPGISDETVLSLAKDQTRILLTFDRDYGELVFRRRMPCPAGVVYLRFDPVSPTEPGQVVRRFLSRYGADVPHHFIVLDRDNFRRRSLPPSD